MCQEASFVLTKTKVFWLQKFDHHEKIIETHKLVEKGVRGVNILRVEIIPPSGDLTAPLKKWEFRYDQDLLPAWADRKRDEERARAELKLWRKAKIIMPRQTIKKLSEYRLACYGTVEELQAGGSITRLCGGTVQEVSDGGTVQEVSDGGTVQEVLDGGTVQKVLDGGTVQKVLDGGTVQKVLDGGTVQKVLGGGTVQEVLDGGTVQEVWGGGTVQKVLGGGTVQEVWGGTVQAYTPLPLSILRSKGAVLIDRSGNTVKCHIGKEA